MKRFFALVALVLGLASCQTEPEGLDVQMGGAVDATITVNIPDSETRAGGTNSAGSAFHNGIIDDADYTVRYILQVFNEDGSASKDMMYKYSDDDTVAFDVRLVPGRDYRFVVWADIVNAAGVQDGTKCADLHYVIGETLQNITLAVPVDGNDKWAAMDETRDAYTGIYDSVKFSATENITLTLKRPFAKLRVITTDMNELFGGVSPHNAVVTYTRPHYNAFNAFSGVASGERTGETHTYTIADYADFVGTDYENTNKVLFTDYFFANESGVVKFTMDVKEANGQSIKYNTFNTDIAVKRNHLTTIEGNILTDGNKVNVTVEDTFGENNNQLIDYKTISSDKEFLAAVNTPGKYVVISDLHIANEGDTVTTLATRAGGATTTIDLNGKTITVDNKGTGALASVAAGNTLVITNSVAGGKIELTEGSTCAFIENNGTVVIENGSIESETNDAPVIENKGTTNITGGVIGDNAVENNETEGGIVNITGGTLEGDGFDDFINDDYTKNENNEIVKKPTIAMIGDNEYTSLIKAVAAVQDGDTITLVNNETFTEENRSDNNGWWDGLSYSGDKSFTIDLGGKTVSQNGALNDYLLWFKNAGSKANTITIKNGTLDAGKTAFCALCTASSHDNLLTINLENVNLINEISNGSTVKVRAGSVLNVKAGTKITGKNSYLGIENWKATVNIYDGAEIYMNGTSSYNGCLAGAGGGGTINVYGGYGKGVKGGFIAMTSGGTINVAGGEWIANTDGTVGDNSNLYVLTAQSNIYESGFVGGAYINVTGGTFRGGMDAWVLNNIEGEDAKLNISGGNFNVNPTRYLTDGCEANEANGIWTVRVIPVAKIGETEYETFEAAVAAAAAAEAGNTITLTRDVTLAEELEIPANVTINGNGKQINGSIYAGGNLTFAGHTKVTAFSASYYDRVITIGEGACLEITGGGRVSLAYGNTFNITGSIEDAKTADKANIQPSLIIPAGISITGGSDAAMNVTNAYVKIGSTSSKNNAANGVFTLNFTNSIAEFTKEFGFYDPTDGKTPKFVMNIKDSVFTTGTKLFVTANSTVTVDNSNVPLGTYLANRGVFNLTNGSEMTGATIQFGENGGNNGTINVDASTLTITTGNNKGHAFDGQGIGVINATNGATVSVEYYKGMTINVDATSTFTGTDVE